MDEVIYSNIQCFGRIRYGRIPIKRSEDVAFIRIYNRLEFGEVYSVLSIQVENKSIEQEQNSKSEI